MTVHFNLIGYCSSRKYKFFIPMECPCYQKIDPLGLFNIYDLYDRKRIMDSYCMHISGSGSIEAKPVFGNKHGSNLSSLGLYALTGIG
uniref:hypothetical protein n=1 Tax=Prevotella sp. TaxID=59823 RepID=UPI004027C9C2